MTKKKQLPFYHAFAIGNPWEKPEVECPECRSDISYGVSQQLAVVEDHGEYRQAKRDGGHRVTFCRKCAGIITGQREPNGRLIIEGT